MKNSSDTDLKIGFISRIDYGSPGYRLGLLKLVAEIFEKECVNFVVYAGGLIYHKFKDQLKEILKGKHGDERTKMQKEFIKEAVDDLVKNLPHIKSSDPDHQWVKNYIVTSPAYDKDIGYQISHRLARFRKADIVWWNHGYGIFPTKKEGRDVAVLTPIKATWLRGKYDSTPMERVILDWGNQHYSKEPNHLVIGCFGSHMQKPGAGESKWPFISVPALCRLWDTKTGSENQVGCVVLEYKTDGTTVIRNYNFNDLLVNETRLINPPRNANEQQKKIVAVMKEHDSQTIGLLAHHLGLGRNRKDLYKNLDELRIDKDTVKFDPTDHWPGLVYDDASKKYYFDQKWFQTQLRFSAPNGNKKKTDSLVAFGCLHAGCVHTNYPYFIDKLPDLIVEREADILVGAGDFVEGLKHDLILRGEVFGGMNNTKQERQAGRYVGDLILRVFKKRMEAALGSRPGKRKRINQPRLKSAIEKNLLTFTYIYGNHCAWARDSGFDPLGTFRSALVNHIAKGAEKFLGDYKLRLPCLRKIISDRIVEIDEREFYKMPSGICLSIRHPWMSRTLTTSIRLQQVLGATETPVVVSANFHVAAGLARWDSNIGERYCLQVGTIKDYSDFEGSKLKRLDTGVGCLKVTSIDGRIWSTEVVFDRANPNISLDKSLDVERMMCEVHKVPIFEED